MPISTNYTSGDLRTLQLPELLNIKVFYNFMEESFHYLVQTWIKLNEFYSISLTNLAFE